MTNTQTAIIAGSVAAAGLAIALAILQPWAREPELPTCISPPRDPVAAAAFAQSNGCRLP
jgi:hypothetical protein